MNTVIAMTRREFLAATSGALAAPPLARLIPLRQGPALPKKPVRLAVIADLHHGLAPDALSRLEAFVKDTKPLYAFMELTPDGHLKVEGREGEFVHAPPKESDNVIGRSASIMDRSIEMRVTV